MNFAQRQRDPRKHLAGIAAVILFHGFVIYALMTGLAKKVIEVVRAPIETKVIEEIKPPPPPVERLLPPPPKLDKLPRKGFRTCADYRQATHLACYLAVPSCTMPPLFAPRPIPDGTSS